MRSETVCGSRGSVIGVTVYMIACLALGGCRQLVDPSSEAGAAVLVGAGDIGWCGSEGPEETARLLDSIPGTVFTTGDNAYPTGSLADFETCYAPSWGRHLSRTRPSPGNHDYETPDASGYFTYFGSQAGPAGLGYYSFDLGGWHIVSLNSNISMQAGSAQEQWLQADLRNAAPCLLAFWHHPLFSSGPHGNDDRSLDIWRVLYERGAKVVLNGHDHLYERFAPQTPTGARDDRGIREFVIGTGGALPYSVAIRRPNSELIDAGSYGVLKLTLTRSAYQWEFVTTGGRVVDSGTSGCR
jgi:hypothetical protein